MVYSDEIDLIIPSVLAEIGRHTQTDEAVVK
jgi:hypothetical protein